MTDNRIAPLEQRPFFRAGLPAALIVVGALPRLLQYAYNRSLWLDEARLAVNIAERGFAGLVPPLDYHQGAPPVFLWLEKISVLALGNHEYALRLPPLLAGLAALAMFYPVARRCLSHPGALIALFLFALSPRLIYYAAEAKQYAFDVLAAVVLLGVGDRLLRHDDFAWKEALLLGAIGAVAAWCSFPAAFVLGGVGLGLLCDRVRRRDRSGCLRLLLSAGVWLGSFAFLYVWFLRGLSGSEYLALFWDDAFMPLPPRSIGDLKWYPRALIELFHYAFHPYVAIPTAAFFLAGCVRLWRRDPARWLMLFGPFVFALAASALERYPFRLRLILFLAPAIYMTTAEGLDWVREKCRGRATLVFAAAFVAVVFMPVVSSMRMLLPREREETRPLVRYLAERYEAGDALLVNWGAEPALRYYGGRLEFRPAGPVAATEEFGGEAEPAEKFRELPREGRLWIFFSHLVGSEADVYREVMDRADAAGTERVARKTEASALHLFVFEPPGRP